MDAGIFGRWGDLLIRLKAAQLVRQGYIDRSEKEDIEHDLALDLLRRLRKFDERLSKRDAHITNVIERRVATIIEHRKAAKRDRRRVAFSLDAPVDSGQGREEPRGHAIEKDVRRPEGSAEELRDMALDVANLMSKLPKDLRKLAKLLKTHSVSEVARRLGVPRSTLYESLRKLRALFEDAGLGDYL